MLLLSLPPALSREKTPGEVTKPRQHYQPSQAQFIGQNKRERGRVRVSAAQILFLTHSSDQILRLSTTLG